MLDNPRGGIGYAAEFQTSALPWVTSSAAPATGSPIRYDFAKVARFITVYNRDPSTTGSISFGFTRNGVLGNNKFILMGGQQVTVELRIKNVFIQGEVGTGPFSLLAGLTTIDASMMPLLSGTASGSFGWDGVG